MENQTIILSGITITEPATSFTDIILCILCIFIFRKISREFSREHFINSWRYFFLFMAISTGIGVVVHGIPTYFSASLNNLLWMIMNINVAFASFFCLKATTKFVTENPVLRKRINILNFIVLSVFVALTFALNNFEIDKIYIAIAVTATFIVHLIGSIKSDAVSKYIMLGMFISFLTIIIHSEQYSFTYWFDYKAISHVIMMLSLLLVYRGVHAFNYQLQEIPSSEEEY